MSGGRADLRNDGAADGCCWRRRCGYALLGRARCVSVERNGPDVLADEYLPFDALVEAGLADASSRKATPFRAPRGPPRPRRKPRHTCHAHRPMRGPNLPHDLQPARRIETGPNDEAYP